MNELLDRLGRELAQHSRSARANYLRYANRFLLAHPDPATWNREAIIQYRQALEQSGLGPATRQYATYAVKKLFEVAGVEKPKIRGGMSAAEVHAQDRKILTREECEALIRAASRSPWREQTAMAALFTVYVVRSAEVAGMRPEYVDLRAGTIALPTGKGGPLRLHGIPGCLRPVLHPDNFPGGRSDTEMWSWWRDLEARAGVPRRRNQGWRSVRRAVTRLLLQSGILVQDVNAWVGWAPREMVSRYPLLPDEQLDEVIFARHPLLGVWAETLGG